MSDSTRARNPQFAGTLAVGPIGTVAGRRPAGPNRTEQRYYDDFLAAQERAGAVTVHYQGLRVYLGNGHAYRPDWVAVTPAGRVTCIEVKGAHVHSRDSRLRFDAARAEWPCFAWVWAQWTGSEWRVER